ncbi:Genome sequencing data, contig C328 [Microcystis aeruginosa PCC 9432]|jgi:antitoxin MazE|uniref:SpoVT-AbrB domain-containing protein n=10 Tax=Microcystis TaxID=1125 RepID=A0A5A5RJ47_MICAE|nr:MULTISPECIES: AbrB/MazE/SpoVT family DNA-binding domain-containing protein [Microcystis]MCZ8305284.1 AbrB/MazE/SpoVT family DNA-binding domain-containing protein [Microcystis sp. LE19-98.1E]MCZ8365506.1 AbrB/MazE/SpoVT family DNA-binding domain-containing protein [Microcystis sp. LE19-251.1A]MDJ0530252.1 AbrB/MazE/SpoVT family DNA-binding domain-containing protein [Microcystis sp. M53600_WE12]MDJ0560449.1 AbrB/MazE/SpoVT family DNA-binding domain-containing protein [Microcystis sp. M53599_WE
MLLKIVQIGNSQAITIPQAIMEQCELLDEVEAIVDGKRIILSAKKKVREGWAELFDDAPIEAELQDWLGVENEFERQNQW